MPVRAEVRSLAGGEGRTAPLSAEHLRSFQTRCRRRHNCTSEQDMRRLITSLVVLGLAVAFVGACGSDEEPQIHNTPDGERCEADYDCSFVYPYSNCVSFGGPAVCARQCQPNATDEYFCATG